MIEDAPQEGVSVEHVRGEIDVPDGYIVLEGTPLGKRRSVGIVVSRFNGGVTNQMLQSALEALDEAGVAQDAITIMPVPGAFELPLAAMALAKTRRYACIVALGAIVRGETPHFDYVASECASGLQLAGIETGRSGRLRGPDRRHRRAGRGADPQGGRGGPLGARDGGSLRPSQGQRQAVTAQPLHCRPP